MQGGDCASYAKKVVYIRVQGYNQDCCVDGMYSLLVTAQIWFEGYR